MNPVDGGRDDNAGKPVFKTRRQGDIGMMEKRERQNQNFEYNHGCKRHGKNHHNNGAHEGGEENLPEMKTDR